MPTVSAAGGLTAGQSSSDSWRMLEPNSLAMQLL
jgi:hypothetical protein